MNLTKNTLDLDFCDKEKLRRVLGHLTNCCYLFKLEVKPSMCKGYHIEFWCLEKCDDCRFVFDDPKRYAIDFKRPAHLTNVLFTGYVLDKFK